MHRLFVTAALGLTVCATPAHAFRVMQESTTATTVTELSPLKDNAACTIPVGTLVEILGTPGGLGQESNQQTLYSIRVLDGPCLNAEMTVAESQLTDITSVPAPTGE